MMKHLRNRIVLIVCFLASLSIAEGLASTVKQLNITARLHRDGTASIEERWLIDLDDSDAKTEWYVAHKGLKGMVIENLTVEGYVPDREGLVRFETLDEWDVDADREDKAGKCGLNNNGQEVCWGFGDYGEHEYVVRYDLRHLVKSYDTCDGFNHCFVDMDCRIENASVTIMGDDGILLSEANTRRWAFGYEGRIEFEGNSIVAKPNETIGNGKRMIIMLEMDKGMFAPDTEGGEPWADKKQRALDGSDYTDNDDSLEDWGFWDWAGLIGVLIGGAILYFCTDLVVDFAFWLIGLLLVGLWWVVSLAPLRKYNRRKKLGIVKGYYYRDIKTDWTLVKNKMVIDDLSYVSGISKENLIGALLLKLMSKGDITIVREKYKRKDRDMIRIVNPIQSIPAVPPGDDRLCYHALKLLTLAAGDDLILQPDEFAKWCKQKGNLSELKNFVNALETKKNKQYIEQNAADLYGLKAFLEDFSLIGERRMMEVELWDQYLVYAAFFGIADKVRAEMGKICPDYLKMSKLIQSLDVAQESNIVYSFSSSIYMSSTSAIQRAADRSRSSSGFSSFSSSGGGGGFSGGGGGGGR